MIKLPSFTHLWKNTRLVVFRFPVQTLITAFAVFISFQLIDNDHEKLTNTFFKLLALSNLAFCLTLSAKLFSEKHLTDPIKRALLVIGALALCVLLFFVLSPNWRPEDIYKLILFCLAGHLLVSFAPFCRQNHIHAFWQYNKLLFLRFLTSALYSAVLFIGLAIALSAMHILFNLEIKSDVYLKLFVFIAIGFNTLFFLAGIPRDLNFFEQDSSYPKGLKVFTQYVLIPLLTIYFGILLVYEVKILIDYQLPNGMVSILIIGYAVFGILSYLLIYPIRTLEGNEWMKTFSKFFFIFMIPFLILLYVAVWVRIADYAITEPRYFLVLLALWLTAVTLYFLISKKPSIQIIPISLCIIALVATFGPQSAASISKSSQIKRYKHLQNGEEGDKEKAAIINYMVNNYGLASLQALTSIDLKGIQKEILEKPDSLYKNSYYRNEKLRDTAFAILKVSQKYENYYSSFANIELQNQLIAVSSYDYMIDIQPYSNANGTLASGEKINAEYIINENAIKIKIGANDSIRMELDSLTQSLQKEISKPETIYSSNRSMYSLPQNKLTYKTSLGLYDLAFVVRNCNIPKSNPKSEKDKYMNTTFNGTLLIKKTKSIN